MTNEKGISSNAYQALREALPVAFHYKRPFESFLRSALRDHPELLAGINLGDLKRYVADEVVRRLVHEETRYQQTTIDLMVAIAGMERFPDLERHEDAEYKLAEARRAVEELRRWTEPFVRNQGEHQEAAARREAAIQQAAALREFTDDLRALEAEFLEMHASDDSPQDRGRGFERFLTKLFELFDLEPRLAYSLASEQIDGSVTFDTDDYIVEARWTKDPVGRDHVDVFASKVKRKGKNALGLLVSVSGFTRGALDAYSQATPFMAMDGVDLMAVLGQQIRLDDLLRRKKLHANETGECFLPVSRIADR